MHGAMPGLADRRSQKLKQKDCFYAVHIAFYCSDIAHFIDKVGDRRWISSKRNGAIFVSPVICCMGHAPPRRISKISQIVADQAVWTSSICDWLISDHQFPRPFFIRKVVDGSRSCISLPGIDGMCSGSGLHSNRISTRCRSFGVDMLAYGCKSRHIPQNTARLSRQPDCHVWAKFSHTRTHGRLLP